jgi:Leucine-rich repeat (LRR) protein
MPKTSPKSKSAKRVKTCANIAEDIAEYFYDVANTADEAETKEESIKPDEICLFNIPPNTERISCAGQLLTGTLAIDLPPSLKDFDCSNNNLTALPSQLPPNLTALNCANNQLTAIPYNLPQNIEYLNCSNNQLKQLPADITTRPNLILCCANNRLAVLPDMPLTLSSYSDFAGNLLDENYPHLFALFHLSGVRYRGCVVAKYINECNAERRKSELQYNMAKYINLYPTAYQ